MSGLWTCRRGNSRARLNSHTGKGSAVVGSLSFAPSGAYATANFDGSIRFFDFGASTPVPAYFPGKALRLAYSPNGMLVATAGDDHLGQSLAVKLWDNATHALFRALPAHAGHAASVAWSGDGKRLASGGGFTDPSVSLWDVQSSISAPLKKFTPDNKTIDAKDVEAVAFHPNQKWLISAGEDGMLRVWDIDSGNELLSVVGFSDGEYLAYAP